MYPILNETAHLIDDYLALCETEENRRRLGCWEREVCARDQWHGRAREGAFRREGAVPLTVDLQNTLWIKRFPQDLSQTYRDPTAYLRFYLQKRIEAFRLFRDDTPLEPIVPIWLHTPFEMALFGMTASYFPDKDPLIDSESAVCPTPAALKRLPPVDFFESGMMPTAHRIYEGIQEIAGDRFGVLFPEWLRGPFGVALFLRGYQNLLMDMMVDPDFAHALMSRVTEERKNYFRRRARFVGETDIPPGSLFNDEVDSGVIGPRHYGAFIKPYELELGRFHRRISYWHSCGDTEVLAHEIADLQCVDVLDVSGWTDLRGVLNAIDGKVPRIDVRLHPIRDLQDASPEHMAHCVQQVLALCRRYDVPAVSIRVSGLQPWSGLESDFGQIQRWISTARRVIEADPQSPENGSGKS